MSFISGMWVGAGGGCLKSALKHMFFSIYNISGRTFSTPSCRIKRISGRKFKVSGRKFWMESIRQEID